jgi:hypothetical protein
VDKVEVDRVVQVVWFTNRNGCTFSTTMEQQIEVVVVVVITLVQHQQVVVKVVKV